MLEELKKEIVDAESTLENLEAQLRQLEGAEEVDKDAVKSCKASISETKKLVKKAYTAFNKAETKAKREQEKEAKRIAKEEEKARVKAEREANKMPEQNGVRCPKPHTKCGQVWALADKISQGLGQPTPIKNLLEAAREEGLNEGNVKTEYSRWRKYHGVTGRVTLPKTEEATETKTA